MNTMTKRNIGSAAASWALSKVGCVYSQPHRLQEKSFDCSSLIARAYIAQGKKWLYGGAVPTSCDEVYDDDFELIWPSSYASIGKKMGGKDVIMQASLPGDIQFLCTDSSTKRINKITHVAMVAGKGKIVHARGTKYGVVVNSIDLYSGKICALVRYNPIGILRQGMKGYRTKSLQQKLNSYGYRITVDGDYGPNTIEAVKAFQGSHGLKSTGMADYATLELINRKDTFSQQQNCISSVTVTGESVNVRIGPGTSYPVFKVVHHGDILNVASSDSWVPIIIEDQVYWISKSLVKVV